MKLICLTSLGISMALLNSQALFAQSNRTPLNQPSVLGDQYSNIGDYAGNRDEVSCYYNKSSLSEGTFALVPISQHLGVTPQLMMNPSVEGVGETFERSITGETEQLRLGESNDLENTASFSSSHSATSVAASSGPYQTSITGVINPIEKTAVEQSEKPILPGSVDRIGLENGGYDCFINSSLQLLKALKLQVSDQMPMLLKFLHNESNLNCKNLREEMADQVMVGHSKFKNVVPNIHNTGSAGEQHDAAEFLTLLLNNIGTPVLQFNEIVTVNDIANEPRPDSTKKLLVSLSDFLQYNNIPINEVVSKFFHFKNEDITIITDRKIVGEAPESFVLEINRSTNNVLKNQMPITNIMQLITVTSNGIIVTYEPRAIICHLGDSIADGHYVCYRKNNLGQWYLFNDNEVTSVENMNGESVCTYGSENYRVDRNCTVIAYVKTDAVSLSEVSANVANMTVSSSVSSTAENTAVDNKQEENPDKEMIAALHRIVSRNEEQLVACYKAANALWVAYDSQSNKKDQLKEDYFYEEQYFKEVTEDIKDNKSNEVTVGEVGRAIISSMTKVFTGSLYSSDGTAGLNVDASQGKGMMEGMTDPLEELKKQQATKELGNAKQKLNKHLDNQVDISKKAKGAERESRDTETRNTKDFANKLKIFATFTNDAEWEKWVVENYPDIDKSVISKIATKAKNDPKWFKEEVESAWEKRIIDSRNYVEIVSNTQHPDSEMQKLKDFERYWQQDVTNKEILDNAVRLKAEKASNVKEATDHYERERNRLIKSDTSSEDILNNIAENRLKEKKEEAEAELIVATAAWKEAEKKHKEHRYVEKETASKKLYKKQKKAVLRNINRAEHRYNGDVEVWKIIFDGTAPEKKNETIFPDIIWPKSI